MSLTMENVYDFVKTVSVSPILFENDSTHLALSRRKLNYFTYLTEIYVRKNFRPRCMDLFLCTSSSSRKKLLMKSLKKEIDKA